jgi:hypothetical protein
MTEQVDEGSILEMKRFEISHFLYPYNLCGLMMNTMLGFFSGTVRNVVDSRARPDGIQWADRKRRRTDFLAMCSINNTMSEEEFRRRLWAFS